MWELEWKKKRAEEEKRELANKKKKKESDKDIYDAWETGSDNDDDTKDVVLIAMEDLELDSELETEKKK